MHGMRVVGAHGIRVAGAMVAAVVVLAVLGSGGPALAATPRDVLVYAGDFTDLISLDPAVVYEFGGILIVHNLYDTLVRFEGGDLSELKPGLAEAWEVRDAGDTWKVTFRLRRGVRFASGRPVTAEAVVYSFDRVIALNQSPAFLFTDIAGLKRGSARALDPHTVEVTLPKSASPQAFLSILTFTVGAIVDPDEVRAHERGGDWGSTWLREHSAGSGPYILERWEPDSQVLLRANPNYWGGRPAISRIVLRQVAEPANQRFMLESGEADVAHNLTPEIARELEGRRDIRVVPAPTLQIVYLGMNASHPVLGKPEVREAIRWAIDYDGIVNRLLPGSARKIQTIIPYGLFGYDPATPFQKDIGKARELLRQAGVGSGFSVELLVPTGPAPGGVAWADVAAKVQADLAEAGIRVHIRLMTQAELLNIYRAQKAEMVLILWGPDFPDPDGNVGPFVDYEARSIAYRNVYRNPELAELAAKARVEGDAARRAQLYREITQRLLHEGPYAVLYQAISPMGVRAGVEGLVRSPMGDVDFRLVTKR